MFIGIIAQVHMFYGAATCTSCCANIPYRQRLKTAIFHIVLVVGLQLDFVAEYNMSLYPYIGKMVYAKPRQSSSQLGIGG